MKAERVISIQEPVEVSATASCKKIDDSTKPLPEPLEQQAKPSMSPLEPVTVSEVQPTTEVKTFKQKKKTVAAESKVDTLESVTISEVHSETKVEEFKAKSRVTQEARVEMPIQESITITEIQPEVTIEKITEKKVKQRRAAKMEDKEQTILESRITRVLHQGKEVEEFLDSINVREFGPGESPLRELAQIGMLFRHGITVSEVTSLYETDRFPSLKTPLAQSALVQLVEREGHGALVSQVLTEESTADEASLASTVGFRAFMKMVELRHATVEEAITHFAPSDFTTETWKFAEATQVSISRMGSKDWLECSLFHYTIFNCI